MATTRRRTRKTGTWIWVVLILFVVAGGVVGLNVTQRFRRAYDESTNVRSVVQEANRRQQMLIKAPARKEFSAAFLQMAFGDNQPLLEEITKSLNQAIGVNPGLQQGDIAMMLVTYRAEGELRDVAIHIFGNLIPENLPAFSSEGHWRNRLPDAFFTSGQSMLSLLGREIVILAKKDVEKKQREVIAAGLSDKYPVVENYLKDPVSFIAVVPEPSRLFSEQFRPYMAAVLVKGKISVDEARMEFVALSYDPQRAQQLAQILSDMRLMAIGVARVRFGAGSGAADGAGPLALQVLSRIRIRADGPTVVATGVLPETVLDKGLPRLLRALSRGIGRIKRGPEYPT